MPPGMRVLEVHARADIHRSTPKQWETQGQKQQACEERPALSWLECTSKEQYKSSGSARRLSRQTTVQIQKRTVRLKRWTGRN